MIKKREVTKSQADLDSFIQGVYTSHKDQAPLNPRVPHKFKTHTISMNEYDLLTLLVEQYGQAHSGIIRFSLNKISSNL